MIINGKPYTNENGHIDDELMSDLSVETQQKVYTWIKDGFIKRKTVNGNHSSYGLKHVLQDDTGIYLTNNQFKDAMMICGFNPVNPNDLNWYYKISQKSPIVKRKIY